MQPLGPPLSEDLNAQGVTDDVIHGFVWPLSKEDMARTTFVFPAKPGVVEIKTRGGAPIYAVRAGEVTAYLDSPHLHTPGGSGEENTENTLVIHNNESVFSNKGWTHWEYQSFNVDPTIAKQLTNPGLRVKVRAGQQIGTVPRDGKFTLAMHASMFRGWLGSKDYFDPIKFLQDKGARYVGSNDNIINAGIVIGAGTAAAALFVGPKWALVGGIGIAALALILGGPTSPLKPLGNKRLSDPGLEDHSQDDEDGDDRSDLEDAESEAADALDDGAEIAEEQAFQRGRGETQEEDALRHADAAISRSRLSQRRNPISHDAPQRRRIVQDINR